MFKKICKWFCTKKGHPAETITRRYFATSQNKMFSVADTIIVDHTSCKCGEVSFEKEVHREGIQRLTMPNWKWQVMKERGRVSVD